MANQATPAQGKDDKKKKERLSSAKKRHLQSLKRQARNRSYKASVNTAIRAYETSVSAKAASTEIAEKLSKVYSLLDKGVKTRRFKINKVARTKSRLSRKTSI